MSKAVVVTGGTRGIGFGLAEQFLVRGCSVIISGRRQEIIDVACEKLAQKTGSSSITGTVCDASIFDQVKALWNFASGCFGPVGIWVNNAGTGQPQTPLWDLDPTIIAEIADTNFRGLLFGCRVASAGMRKQPDGGAIYNMEGMGSDGMKIKGMTVYGSSKRAVSYITDSFALELKGTGVLVGSLQPGMVATDLVTRQYIGKPDEWKKVVRIFNIIGDRVENVTPWLVSKMLSNRKNGARFNWFIKTRALCRFATAAFLPRNIFPESITCTE